MNAICIFDPKSSFNTIKISGSISFYRPANKVLDITFPIDSTVVDVINDNLIEGLYVIKANWIVDGKNYVKEQSIYLQK